MAVGNAHLYAKCPVFIGDDTIRRFGMGVCCLASAHNSLTIGNHLNQQHLTRGDSEKRSAAIVSLSRAARVARSVSVRSAGIHYPPERALCRRRDALALPLTAGIPFSGSRIPLLRGFHGSDRPVKI